MHPELVNDDLPPVHIRMHTALCQNSMLLKQAHSCMCAFVFVRALAGVRTRFFCSLGRVPVTRSQTLCVIKALLADAPARGPRMSTHRPLSSSLLGFPYRILNINHKKELLRGLWVASELKG